MREGERILPLTAGQSVIIRQLLVVVSSNTANIKRQRRQAVKARQNQQAANRKERYSPIKLIAHSHAGHPNHKERDTKSRQKKAENEPFPSSPEQLAEAAPCFHRVSWIEPSEESTRRDLNSINFN